MVVSMSMAFLLALAALASAQHHPGHTNIGGDSRFEQSHNGAGNQLGNPLLYSHDRLSSAHSAASPQVHHHKHRNEYHDGRIVYNTHHNYFNGHPYLGHLPPNGFPQSVPPGSPCGYGLDCSGGSACVGSICTCPLSTSLGHGLCVPAQSSQGRGPPGEPCYPGYACGGGSICQNDVCTCPAHQHAKHQQCVDKPVHYRQQNATDGGGRAYWLAIPGSASGTVHDKDIPACKSVCTANPQCKGFVYNYVNRACYLKKAVVPPQAQKTNTDTDSFFKTYNTTPAPCASTPTARDGACVTCRDLYKIYGCKANGVYTIHLWDPVHKRHLSKTAVCDMERGGYTLFQQRVDGKVAFSRTWATYKAGFGDVSLNGSHWLGNDALHLLTNNCGPQQLRVDMKTCNGQTAYEVFSSFKVAPESDHYRLNLAGPCGTAGDGRAFQNQGALNGMAFSTRDRDHDRRSTSCSRVRGNGGWWYDSCSWTLLNGVYMHGCPGGSGTIKGIWWYSWPVPPPEAYSTNNGAYSTTLQRVQMAAGPVGVQP